MHWLEPYKNANMGCLKRLQEAMEPNRTHNTDIEDLRAEVSYLRSFFFAFLWVWIATWSSALLWLMLQQWDVIEEGDKEVA
jgi:hypothetical protein